VDSIKVKTLLLESIFQFKSSCLSLQQTRRCTTENNSSHRLSRMHNRLLFHATSELPLIQLPRRPLHRRRNLTSTRRGRYDRRNRTGSIAHRLLRRWRNTRDAATDPGVNHSNSSHLSRSSHRSSSSHAQGLIAN